MAKFSFPKFLRQIKVVEEVSNAGRKPYLGKGFSTAIRLNRWNPLSYIGLIIVYVIGLIAYGVVGFWDQVYVSNPFKWR